MTGAVGSVFFVRWVEPALDDVEHIVHEVEALSRSVKMPCVYVAIIGDGVPPPDEKVRKAMTDAMPRMLEHCATMHFVIEGTGFGNALARSALAATLLLAPARKRTYVHKRVEEVFRATPAKIRGGDGDTIIRIARARGYLGATEDSLNTA